MNFQQHKPQFYAWHNRIPYSSTHRLECRGRIGHLGGVVLDDVPLAVLLPVGEGEAGQHLDGGPVRPLPREGVVAPVDGEVPVHARRRRVVLDHPELGHAGEEVLCFLGRKK